MVVALSHSGGTPEVVEACKLAQERGAYIFTMTSTAGSIVDAPEWDTFVYDWQDDHATA